MALLFERERPLAPLTSLGLGGPAAEFVEVSSREQLREALSYAKQHALALGILGGGSNLVVGDAGFPGLVVRIASCGVELVHGEHVSTMTVQAGESWDTVVELAVGEQLAGIECLTGIPGSVGATPIQNVGAYGQEVSEVIAAVEVYDRHDDAVLWLEPAACEFGYRTSCFKREPQRFVVLAVRLHLQTKGVPTVRYRELARALAVRESAPDLRTVQQAVRALRKQKGMLIDDSWLPSAGSFFTNPIVSEQELEQIVARALANKSIEARDELPHFSADAGRVKLSAGFLIERAGIARGVRSGAFGVSPKHALALVHYGGGRTAELLDFATQIREQVRDSFGVALEIEPVRWNVGSL